MKSHHIPLYKVRTEAMPHGGTMLNMEAARIAKQMLESVGIPATIVYAKSVSIREYRER